MSDLLRLLLLQDANTRTVLIGASLLGLASGIIGSFAVLRRRALVGDAVSHAALPGICLAYFVVGDKSFAAFLGGALVFGLLGVLVIAFVRRHTRIKEDAAIGIVLGSFFGLGIVLKRFIQNQPGGNRAGLDTFIFGKAASMVTQDAALIAAVAGLIIVAVAALFKELRLLCFDREFAGSQGWPVLRLDLTLMGLIAVCTVVGLPAVGVVLMAALLITPGVAARFWTDRLSTMVVLGGAFGLFSGLLGTALSAVLPGPANALSRGQPTGPMIALSAGAVFLISLLAAPRRGVVAELQRRRRLRARIALQNLLRDLHESSETGHAPTGSLPVGAIRAFRSWSETALDRAIRRASARGLVRYSLDRLELSEAGRAEAARIVRAHRLWELYLIDQAGIAPDHVDRDADEIEHYLPRDVLERLEARLTSERHGSAPEFVPASPHPLAMPGGKA